MDFSRIDAGVMDAALEEGWADVVYFDAFAPAAQPELWTVPVMDRMRWALKPGSIGDLLRQGRRPSDHGRGGVPGGPNPRPPRQARNAARHQSGPPQGRFNVRAYMVVVQRGGSWCPTNGCRWVGS